MLTSDQDKIKAEYLQAKQAFKPFESSATPRGANDSAYITASNKLEKARKAYQGLRPKSFRDPVVPFGQGLKTLSQQSGTSGISSTTGTTQLSSKDQLAGWNTLAKSYSKYVTDNTNPATGDWIGPKNEAGEPLNDRDTFYKTAHAEEYNMLQSGQKKPAAQIAPQALLQHSNVDPGGHYSIQPFTDRSGTFHPGGTTAFDNSGNIARFDKTGRVISSSGPNISGQAVAAPSDAVGSFIQGVSGGAPTEATPTTPATGLPQNITIKRIGATQPPTTPTGLPQNITLGRTGATSSPTTPTAEINKAQGLITSNAKKSGVPFDETAGTGTPTEIARRQAFWEKYEGL